MSYPWNAVYAEGDTRDRRPETSEEALLPLRRDQLEFRRHEVYTVYHTFVSMLHRRRPLQVETRDGSDIDWSSWKASDDQPLVEHSRDVALAGHSFGGCTMVITCGSRTKLHAANIVS